MKISFLADWFRGSTFARWQRVIALTLSTVLVLNSGLFSYTVYAETFEVTLDEFRDDTPEDLQEFGLVNVLVEAGLQAGGMNSHLQGYCQRVQEELGAVCLITPWQGETASRMVEALQQMYFEGVEVEGGIAKLVGLVIVGDVPLPVVHNGIESFPSIFPYTDLVKPAYVYDPDQGKFVRSSVDTPQAEVWHGLIRPPGEGEARLDALRSFFEKNAQYYAGEDDFTLVDDSIGFHDHFWENDSFDNETKKWYLQKLEVLDRLFNYRYTGEWLAELSGEAVDRLNQLTSRTFEDSPVDVERTESSDVDGDIGFDPAAIEREANQEAGRALTGNDDIDAYGADRLSETVPDPYSAGPIRNFLKDYVNVVARYISGSTELLDRAGRRQSAETLASLITKMDRFHSTIIYLINQEFEQYLYQEAEKMALDFELIWEHEELNEFYTEEATDIFADIKAQLAGEGLGPLGIESKAKDNILGYGSKIYTHFVNGLEVAGIQSAEHCSIERGSNFVADDGEIGKVVSMNRKDNPLTSQDISGVEGRKAEEEIEEIYKSFGFCSYMVKEQCVPARSKRPLFDFTSSEVLDVDNDFRRCFGHDGPPAPKDTETAKFHNIPSIINHVQPTGGVVNAMLEKKLAHYFPIDAVRHASFFLGGGSQYADANVGRLRYPNFFDLEAAGEQAVIEELAEVIEAKERDLRQLRVEANWKRFAQYISYSIPAQGRPDFWNYNEIDGFDGQFLQYRNAVMTVLKRELDPNGEREDYELVEEYLIGDGVSQEVEEELQALLLGTFPNALAKQDLELTCDYSYEIPPIDVNIEIPEIDQEDIFSPSILLESVIVPDFNPPSISRECDYEIAKSTRNEAKSLKAFYDTPGGVGVDIAMLHNADRFVEVINPVNVILYFTPVPPPLPPNTNMVAAIKLFDLQVEELEEGDQPATVLSKEVKPVPLVAPGELQSMVQEHRSRLEEAVDWLNLSIEGKHKRGLSMLTDDKEMAYLVLNGDDEHIDFTFDSLRGAFEEGGDVGIASDANLLDEIRDRERKLQEQQEADRDKRALQRRVEGEKSSECGDSVPLLEWPGAVSCWLNEITAGPLIEQPPGEEDERSEESAEADGAAGSTQPSGEPGTIVLSQEVLTLRDRATATVNLPLEVEVQWFAEGAVKVAPGREGTANVTPIREGEGTVRAVFDAGTGQRTEVAAIRVTNRKAHLSQVTLGDLEIGSEDVLHFEVEIRDVDNELVAVDTTLQVFPEETGVFVLPNDVTITAGKGSFEARPSRKAKLSGLAVGSDVIAHSDLVMVNTLAGEPSELRWDFGDQIMGLDNVIDGELLVYDRFGNPFRAEGMRVQLEWDQGLRVNGRDDGSAAFFMVAGKAPLKVELSDELAAELDEQSGFGYGYDPAEEGSRFQEDPALGVRVVSIDGFEELLLPDPLELDLSRDYRVQLVGAPDQVTAAQPIAFRVRVEGVEGVLPLQHKVFSLEKEFAGEVEAQSIPITGAAANVEFSAGVNAGTLSLIIDDPDFGSVLHEVEVLGQRVAEIRLDAADYVNGEVAFQITGTDALGNVASLQDKVGQIRLVADGGAVVEEQSVVIEDELWQQVLLVRQQPDRVRLELSVEGIEESVTDELALQHRFDVADVNQLNWDTPYVVLAGSAFGDYRNNNSIAQAMLFGGFSRVQALTTELTPHYGGQQTMRVFPSGRVEVGPEMKVEAIFENLKPSLVFSDPDGEVGRLLINPRRMPFVVERTASGAFDWTLAEGRGKAILVPDQGRYDSATGDLLSSTGQRLLTIQNLQIDVHDLELQTEVFADQGDVLILDFLKQGSSMARLYLHLNAEQVSINEVGPLQWRFTGQHADRYRAQVFYAGESTADQQGMVLTKKGAAVRYSLGQGRPALDDVRDVNGQGFEGRDKSALAFLAGNSVGEATLLQSEGMINMGDPVLSLRNAKHRLDSGEVISAIEETGIAAQTDFSIGQLVYAPSEGEITHLLRLDVEGDGEDDLVVVLDDGGKSVVRYLEGQGEGARWGDVTDLLDLGDGVKQVEAVQNRSIVVLKHSGELSIEQNLQGRFIHQEIDLSALGDDASISTITVRDFDQDRRDDLLMLTGQRQLWIWYGRQTLEGIQFGVEEDDRQLLQVVPVRLEDFENLKTAAWLYTEQTPALEPNCREPRFECQSKFFRGFRGLEEAEPAEEVDRLQQLIDQSQDTAFQEQEEVFEEQKFLVRLDQLSFYKDSVTIDITSHQPGEPINLNDQLDFELSIAPRRGEDMALRYVLGADFELVGRVDCEGCSEDLKLTKTPDTLWGLEGRMSSARPITVRFSVRYVALPPFSFQIMFTNDDEFPDVGLNVADNPTGRITVFESRGPRQYVDTIFGENTAEARPGSTAESKELSDLMRGIGLENTSDDQLKQMLLQQQQQIEASTADLFDTMHQDENVDGYPDIYQENPSLFPDSAVQSSETSAVQPGKKSLFDRLSQFIIPQVRAQTQNVDTFNTFKPDSFSNLDNAALMLDNIQNDVELMVKALKCSRGCLPLPINFAFLAPGPINIMGTPAGFDPGVPIFGVSPVPFFVWPPLVPYQVTQFRIYLSPTLTLGLGVGICLGQYLLGQCFVFSIPIGSLLGGESTCDAVKKGLGGLMQGIQSTIGQVTQGFADAVNQTGVIKAEVPANPTQDIESILGVFIGGKSHNRGVNPGEQKVFLNPIPNIFVDWWDRQWEEVVNSLTDLPDITVRLPDFSSSIDKDYFDKLSEKVSGETFLNLQQLYDLINSLPVISLHPDVIQVQVPWIEPGLLRKIEQSLYKFLYTFLLEFVGFLRSFNLPCNITVNRNNLFNQIRDRAEQKGISEISEQRIQQLQIQLEQEGVELQQVEQDLERFSEEQGFAQETVQARRDYFNELRVRHEQAETLNKRYDELESELQRLEQPQKITDTLVVWADVLKLTIEFWGEQAEGLSQASAAQGVKRETTVALRSCIANNIALDMAGDVQGFIDSIKENIEALEEWKEFPRQLARYLNALEFYIEEVVEMVDQLTSIVLKWWSEFERKLDLWIDVLFAYQELVALIKLIIDILKGYNKKCGLCTSDRLTLKEIILKLIFGVVPKFPVIDFPNWPDVMLDFSKVQLGIDVTVPVFEVKSVDLKWPELPSITFPRFDDIDFNLDLSAGFSVKLPEVPLVIPKPPALPPLQPLPDLPTINLPNLPPAPEVPQVLEALLPLMKIIQTILDIWCLINKSLIPIDEKQLKTQIENLTNRSLNLILPIDVLLTFDLLPGDLITSLVPFDLINVSSEFEAQVDFEPIPDVETTIEEQFHKPINTLTQQIDLWINALRNSLQEGAGDASGALSDTIQQFDFGGTGLEFDASAEASVGPGGVDVESDFPGLINSIDPLPRPKQHLDLIQGRKEDVMAYNDGLKTRLQDFQGALAQLSDQQPEELLQQLASLEGDHILAAGGSSLLQHEVGKEKRQALLDPNNFVERKIALLDKPALIAQGEQTGTALKDIQEQLLATDELGIEHLGVAVVRNGQASRIQDYPLGDPVVNVWDNDLFLAYENALYLKASDNSARRHQPYTGRVLQASLDQFQRSKVHQLEAERASSGQAGGGNATVKWTWDAPGVRDVELTIWDSVAGAQKLDQEHLRFYLRQEQPEVAAFEAITKRITLEEAQPLITQAETRLRFGNDLVVIPRGIVFTIPSLSGRVIEFDGEGVVQIDNISGQRWDVELGSGVELEVTGLVEMTVPAGQSFTLPAVQERPTIRRIDGEAEGALRSRVEVLRGEPVPEGILAAQGSVTLQDEQTGTQMTLPKGMTFEVKAKDDWFLQAGRATVVVSEDLEFAQATEDMVLMDDELVRGTFVVDDRGQFIDVFENQEVIWTTVDGSTFEVTLPEGNYYGRIREQEGKRGYSPIVHGAAQELPPAAQLAPGVERIRVPIYSPVRVDASDFVFEDVPAANHHWQLGDEEALSTGTVYQHPGFSSVGERDLQLLVRSGEDGVVSKSFVLDVFIPEIEIDEILFEDARVLRIQTDPPVPNVPIGIVGERDGAQDWLLSPAAEGSRLGTRYYTNERGIVQLQALEDLEGLNIIVDGGRNVARLYRNSRVVLHDEFREECQNEPLLDRDGYLKFRVSCTIDGRLMKKFEVRMVPHRDSDVSIVDQFTDFDAGVVIRSLQEAIEIVPLPVDAEFAAGGALVKVPSGDILFVIDPAGRINQLEENLLFLPKAFDDPAEPLFWQVTQNDALLAEIQVKGPGENIDVLDPIDRDDTLGDEDGDGILDQWEQTYGIDDPSADPDTDGLTNLQEFQAGTDPNNLDTDGDGLSDGEEINPVNAGSSVRSVSFLDVPESNPYHEAIMELARFGFIQGYGDGSFRPDQPVTRAEAIKILMSVIRCENCEFPSQGTRDQLDPTLKDFEYFVQFHNGVFDGSSEDPLKNFAFGEDAVTGRDSTIRTYLDVAVSDWFYFCVEIATEIGLIHGYRGFEDGVNALGNFIPNRNVNVAELMKMVIEAVGDSGKASERVYAPADGWWNDPQNNYMAKAEEDLQLLLNDDDYQDPLRKATRAEVAFAAFRVLRENGVLDFDNDGIANASDKCPCQAGQFDQTGIQHGCPFTEGRRPERLFEGIEIIQALECRCLALVDADLFVGSRFFAVITGAGDEEETVLKKSNSVGPGGG